MSLKFENKYQEIAKMDQLVWPSFRDVIFRTLDITVMHCSSCATAC